MPADHDDIKQTEHQIKTLHAGGKLSMTLLPVGSTAYRVQGSGHKNAEYYGCPQKPEEMGRFNDPWKEIGIWYGAEHPSGALAETFGRLRPKSSRGLGVVLNITDLETSHGIIRMATVVMHCGRHPVRPQRSRPSG